MTIKKWLFGSIATFTVIGIGYYLFQQNKSDIVSLYPRSPETFVGDPMPYFDENEFKIYYLEDLRDGQVGFHPFSLLTTQDFYHYQENPNVIPFVNEADSPEVALGTGSIIKIDNTYHAFYTGHNGSLSPKEVIMHATSKDGISFDKIPEDTFMASENYSKDDFRDPYVFYEETSQLYWMLITTRKDNQGIIAKYTSKDLNKWEDAGVFFENDLGNDANLECPSLVYFKGKWILAFSDQWDQRVVHYRVSDSPTGPFEKPVKGEDYVDGNGFYAGRLVTNEENLYVAGWVPTKEGHTDRGNYNWAGNLAVHQLTFEDDTISAKIPDLALKNLKKTSIPTSKLSSGQSMSLDSTKATLFEGSLTTDETTKTVAIRFSKDNHIILDFETGHLFYTFRSIGLDSHENAVSAMPFVKDKKDHQLSIVKENGIVIVYMDGVALSSRMYETDKEIEIIAHDGTIEFK